jgi:hypothetical protein
MRGLDIDETFCIGLYACWRLMSKDGEESGRMRKLRREVKCRCHRDRLGDDLRSGCRSISRNMDRDDGKFSE